MENEFQRLREAAQQEELKRQALNEIAGVIDQAFKGAEGVDQITFTDELEGGGATFKIRFQKLTIGLRPERAQKLRQGEAIIRGISVTDEAGDVAKLTFGSLSGPEIRVNELPLNLSLENLSLFQEAAKLLVE